jgi:hypothetical protein
MDGGEKYFACVPTGRIHEEWMIAHKMLQHTFAGMLAYGRSTDSCSDLKT